MYIYIYIGFNVSRRCGVQTLGLECSRFGAATTKTKRLGDFVPALVYFAASCCNFVEATEPDGVRVQCSGVC